MEGKFIIYQTDDFNTIKKKKSVPSNHTNIAVNAARRCQFMSAISEIQFLVQFTRMR